MRSGGNGEKESVWGRGCSYSVCIVNPYSTRMPKKNVPTPDPRTPILVAVLFSALMMFFVKAFIAITFSEAPPGDEGTGQPFQEGFWASHEDPLLDTYESKYPWPSPHPDGVPHKEALLKALHDIQTSLEGTPGEVSYRGLAPCRLCDQFVGSREYTYSNPTTGDTVTWPQGYSHYIEEHNVRPSRRFYAIVLPAAKV